MAVPVGRTNWEHKILILHNVIVSTSQSRSSSRVRAGIVAAQPAATGKRPASTPPRHSPGTASPPPAKKPQRGTAKNVTVEAIIRAKKPTQEDLRDPDIIALQKDISFRDMDDFVKDEQDNEYDFTLLRRMFDKDYLVRFEKTSWSNFKAELRRGTGEGVSKPKSGAYLELSKILLELKNGKAIASNPPPRTTSPARSGVTAFRASSPSAGASVTTTSSLRASHREKVLKAFQDKQDKQDWTLEEMILAKVPRPGDRMTLRLVMLRASPGFSKRVVLTKETASDYNFLKLRKLYDTGNLELFRVGNMWYLWSSFHSALFTKKGELSRYTQVKNDMSDIKMKKDMSGVED